jgi:hypothetical protein
MTPVCYFTLSILHTSFFQRNGTMNSTPNVAAVASEARFSPLTSETFFAQPLFQSLPSKNKGRRVFPGTNAERLRYLMDCRIPDAVKVETLIPAFVTSGADAERLDYLRDSRVHATDKVDTMINSLAYMIAMRSQATWRP